MRSGRGFDGGQGRDFADFLRRELHAAADQVEPGADGLERIRAKIRSRPAHASQPKGLLGVWAAIVGFTTALVRRLGVRRAPQRREPKRPRDWREAMLRPAFGVGAAVFALGVVLAVVPPARQAMAQVGDAISSAFNSSSSSGAGADGGPGHELADALGGRGRAVEQCRPGRAALPEPLCPVVHAPGRGADQDQLAAPDNHDDHRAGHVVQREPEQRSQHHECQRQCLRQREHQPEREPSVPAPVPAAPRRPPRRPPAPAPAVVRPRRARRAPPRRVRARPARARRRRTPRSPRPPPRPRLSPRRARHRHPAPSSSSSASASASTSDSSSPSSSTGSSNLTPDVGSSSGGSQPDSVSPSSSAP